MLTPPGPQQLPSSTSSGEQRGETGAEETKTRRQLGRMGWTTESMFRAKEPNIKGRVPRHDHGHGNARVQLPDLVCAKRHPRRRRPIRDQHRRQREHGHGPRPQPASHGK